MTCADCHDPHYGVKPSDRGKKALSRPKEVGSARAGSRPQHKLCYRCHGSSGHAERGTEDIERLMAANNPSFHPVESRGRNRDVPSLIQPFDEQSYIACVSCHGSDQANGPEGPHGSIYAPILKAHYSQADGRAESAYEYALCYTCHSRSVLLSSASAFPEHRKHVVDEETSCHVCHDSHGSVKYGHLIDFDSRIVYSNSKGRLDFRDLGARHGECNMTCHGKDHDAEVY